MKRIYISAILIMLSSIVFGQFVGKDNFSKSMYYLQKQEIDSAKKYIDLSMVEPEQAALIKTIYYKGYIYKELYKLRDKSKRESAYRKTSVKSFKEVLSKDTEKEFTESTKKILKYLSSTYYNDAARSLSPETFGLAKTNYTSYREIMELINPSEDLDAQDVKFKMALASMLSRTVEQGKPLDSLEFRMVKELSLEVLVLDSNNAGANYNLAILFYNEGADLINGMDYDMDLEKMNEIQDECVDIFLNGLPYMKKAYELNYKKQETLIGLSNIYYGFNDIEKSDYYKSELKAMEGVDNPNNK